jgi:hypothetical protein
MNPFCPPRHFRRDANIQPAPDTIIAEFGNGEDARDFARMKGPGFYVSPGINHVFAVRTALSESKLPAPSGSEDLSGAAREPRFLPTPRTESGREMMPVLAAAFES